MGILLLLIGVALALALPVVVGPIRTRLAASGPQQRNKLLTVAGLVTAGVCCILAAMILLMFAIAGAADDVGSTWANSQADTLGPAMVFCLVGGIGSFTAAWLIRRRD
jgi:hypothetical protein